jgi:hypothetical protein
MARDIPITKAAASPEVSASRRTLTERPWRATTLVAAPLGYAWAGGGRLGGVADVVVDEAAEMLCAEQHQVDAVLDHHAGALLVGERG